MVAKHPVTFVLLGLLAGAGLALPTPAPAAVALSITVAPPPLPVYEQPEIPGPGYLWTPGYWAYGPEGYFWVPGTWVMPPTVGLLWTPGYWGWSAGVFAWNAGYWGPQVGFYGGVNYGYGYGGHGYEGGYWRNNQFYYNRDVTRINNVHVTNVYNKTVINNVNVQRVSYVGGPGGVTARPTRQEQQAAGLQHRPPTAEQTAHRESAASHRELLASVNQGKPQIAATAKPNDFSSHVVAANRAGGPMPVPVHARDLPKGAQAAPLAQNATEEQRNQARDAAALQARHDQERESLAQQQEQDHARLAAQAKSATPVQAKSSPAQAKNSPAQAKNSQAMEEMERQHQQQTQQLQQRHAAEMQQHAPPSQQVAHAAPPPGHAAPPPAQHPQGH
jgi:WXXGXW repeat (2 copies)